MKERPILFSAPMVRALLDGSKTQTRRICKPAEAASLSRVIQAYKSDDGEQRPPYITPGWFGDEEGDVLFYCPYGHTGDRLWVRETFVPCGRNSANVGPDFLYRADLKDGEFYPSVDKWKPSIFMPRRASRITLEIISVRVERLQDISYKDALAEGILSVDPDCKNKPAASYAILWESINGTGSWDANPWVWVIEFKRVMA